MPSILFFVPIWLTHILFDVSVTVHHIQGWAMKREDFKAEVGLTAVKWGGGELASPLL